jgi:hypothetical protein
VASDISLELLSSCDINSSVCDDYSDVSGDESISFIANTTGTFFIVVDSYSAGSYVYELTVDITRAPEVQTIGWCNTQYPETITANGETVYGRVYVAGVTDAAGQGTGITAELCYFVDGETMDNSTCVPATYNTDDAGNDEYMATLPDLADGYYSYYFQFKNDGDTVFSPCDLNNTVAGTNGTDYANGGTYLGDTGIADITTVVAGDVFISEYIEGSSNNKAIEIYNGTSADIDLSNYQLWKISNGGEWTEATLQLTGTLVSGDVYVVCNSSSVQAILDVCDKPEGNISTFNGDDAVGLARENNGTFELIDAVGTNGADPGSSWSVADVSNGTVDHTLVRKSSVSMGNIDWASSAGTNTTDSEWEVLTVDTFTSLGSHTVN